MVSEIQFRADSPNSLQAKPLHPRRPTGTPLISFPSLKTDHPLINTAFRIAIGDFAGNIQPWQGERAASPVPCILDSTMRPPGRAMRRSIPGSPAACWYRRPPKTPCCPSSPRISMDSGSGASIGTASSGSPAPGIITSAPMTGNFWRPR